MFRQLRTYQLVVDVVVGGAIAFLGLILSRPDWLSNWATLVTVVVCIGFGGALAVRRISPGLALGIAWLAAIVQMVAGRDPAVIDLAVFGVLYVTAAYGSRVVFWLGFGSAIFGAIVITAYVFGRQGMFSASLSTLPLAAAVLVAALFALLLSWTVGALVRTGLRARANRLAQERAEAEATTEQERVRIARDMHDVVAHSLAVVIAQADGARYAAASDPAAAGAALDTISGTARAALADVRVLLTQLRHSQSRGPQPTIADLEGLYAQVRAAGVDLAVDVDPAPPAEPPAAVQLAVYRILQEALTNAMRHGGGRVDLRLSWWSDRVDLEVRNPARGEPSTGQGHGLIGMRERAQLAGGALAAGLDGAAFVVRGTIPLGMP